MAAAHQHPPAHTHAVPPGLARSRPRTVGLTAAGRVVVSVAVALFAAAVTVGILLFRDTYRRAQMGVDGLPLWAPSAISIAIAGLGVACLYAIHRQRQLLAEGRAAPAVVTRHHTHKTSHGGSHRSIEYEFPLLSGARQRGKCHVQKQPAIGSTIWVVYDPEPPHRSAMYPLMLVTSRS